MHPRQTPVSVTLLLCFATSALAQTTYTWTGDNTNNWDANANWTGAPGWPDDPSVYAYFSLNGHHRNVDLRGGDRSVGKILTSLNGTDYSFDSNNGGSGTLRLYGDMDVSGITGDSFTFHDSDSDPNGGNGIEFVQAANGTWTNDNVAFSMYSNLSGGSQIDMYGDVTFYHANDYTGNFRIHSGVTTLANADAFANAIVTLDSNNGLDLGGLANVYLGALQGGNTLNIGGSVLNVGSHGSNRTFSGTLAGTAFQGAAFTYSGTSQFTLAGPVNGLNSITAASGELRFSGNNADVTGDGELILDGGDVSLVNDASLNVDALAGSGGFVTLNSNMLSIDGSVLTTGKILSNSGGTVDLTDPASGSALVIGETSAGSRTSTFDGVLTGTGGFDKVGSGAWTLTNANTFSGNAVIDDGSVVVDNANALSNATAQINTDDGLDITTHSIDANIGGLEGAGNLDLGSQTLTLFGTGADYTAAISGAGSLIKLSSGTQGLWGASTFSGGVSILNGTLDIRDSAAMGTGDVDAFGGTLAYGNHITVANDIVRTADNSFTLKVGGGQATQAGAISESGGQYGFNKTGVGSLVLGGANTYSGPTDIDDGRIIVANVDALQNSTVSINVDDGLDVSMNDIDANLGGLAGSGNLDLGTQRVTVGSNDASTTYSGVLAGDNSSRLTKTGDGTLTLTAANTFNGGTTITRGRLRVVNPNALQNSTVSIDIDDGLDITTNAIDANLGGLAGSGALDIGSQTLTVGSNGADTTYSGVLTAGTDSHLAKVGNGTLGLAGGFSNLGGLSNTGGGVVAITADGDVQHIVSSGGSIDIGNGANVELTSDDVNTFYLNNGASGLIHDGANVALTSTTPSTRVVQTQDSTLTVGGAGSALSSPRISVGPAGAGGPAFVAEQNAAVETSLFEIGDLGADDGTSGTVSVNSGASVTADQINLFLRGALQVNAGQVVANRLVDFGSAEPISISDGPLGAALVLGDYDGDSSIDNLIEDDSAGAGSILKSGSGTLTLGGANIFTGGITMDGGTLSLQNSTAAGAGTISMMNASLDYAEGVDVANSIHLQNDATFNVSTGSATQSGVVTETGGSHSVTKTGAGELILTSNNTFTGTTVINDGSIGIDSSNALLNSTVEVNVDDGLIINTSTADLGGLAGTGDLDISDRTLTVGGNGASTIYSGAIQGSYFLEKTGAGTLTLTTPSPFDGFVRIGGGVVKLGEANALQNALVWIVNDSVQLDLNEFNATIGGLNGAGDLDLGDTTLTVNPTAYDGNDYSGIISGTGGLVIGAGDFYQWLNGASTFSGGVVLDGGKVLMNNSSAGFGTGQITVQGVGSTICSTTDVDVANDIELDGQLHIWGRYGPITLSGTIGETTGSFGLTKTGDYESLTLTGDNTFSGGVTVVEGPLFVNNSTGSATGSGPVQINGTASLGGTGSVAGTVTVASGGTIAPGASAGTLSIGSDLNLQAGSTFAVEIGGTTPGSEYDQLVVNSTATLGGTLDLSYIDTFTAAPGQSFVILTAGSLSGTFDAVNYPDSQPWMVEYDEQAGTVTLQLCTDSDGDGVCDANDVCPGFDDNMDTDSDGIPDGCDSCPNRKAGDVNGDGVVTIDDVPPFVSVLLDPDAATPDEYCAADVNEDGAVNGLDTQAIADLLLVP